MEKISPEDKERMTSAIQRTVASAALKKIQNLIDHEQEEAKSIKRIAGVLCGLILGLFWFPFYIYSLFFDKFADSLRLHENFLTVFFSILPHSLFAILPFAFSAYFLFRYRYTMSKCIGVGIFVALGICAIGTGYQLYIVS